MCLLEQSKLLQLLTKYEELFDGTLEDFDTDPVKFNLQLGAKAYPVSLFQVPKHQMTVFEKEVERLVKMVVLK